MGTHLSQRRGLTRTTRSHECERCTQKCVRHVVALVALLAGAAAAQEQAKRPDGLYAEIRTSRGLIVARLEADLTPLTVANFVGLAEGTIANSAFDLGRPFYDGSVYHRVVPGHVIQTGIPQSDRAKGPGYTFPNEIHARLSHNHAGALNMANGGPNTNASQFCITLGDRSYLDGDFNVFGDVVEGMDVVMRIVQGDVVESVRIVRVGAKAQAFHPTTESFQAMVLAARQRVAEQAEKKRLAERDWIAHNYPRATGPIGGVLTEQLAAGHPAANSATAGSGGPLRVRYRGSEVRYAGDVLGRDGPPLQTISFGSGESGVPGFVDPPQAFTVEPGKTKLNPGLDGAIAAMQPGERRVVIVPAPLGYGSAGLYPPEIPGKRRFVVSPNALLVYDVEVLANQ
jgi:cyclophilin family peptidyl-prolyl cis-trans isomerase